jgi:hypothetical protein
VDTGDRLVDTVDEVARTARATVEAVVAVPADRDRLPRLPRSHPVADGVDGAGDLVARHTRVVDRWATLDGRRVPVTDAAGVDCDPDRLRSGIGDRTVDVREVAARFGDGHGTHRDTSSGRDGSTERLVSVSARRTPSVSHRREMSVLRSEFQ